MPQMTDQQRAAVSAASSGRSNILISSVAGSGKSFTLGECLREAPETPESICMLAFNKSTNEEWKQKLPESVANYTFNGMGFKTWSIFQKGQKQSVDGKKLNTLTGDVLKAQDADPELFHPVRDLAKIGKQAGILPMKNVPAEPLADDSDFEWQVLASYYDVFFTPEVLSLARNVLKKSVQKANKGWIDFDDQLYMPILFCPSRFPQYPLLGVDEVQDLNNLQHRMVHLLGNRIIAAGDDAQSIYAFRGASSGGMQKMSEELEMEEHRLTYSFRCSQAVCQEARQVVPDIEPAPGNPLGNVQTLDSWNLAEVPSGSAILCRKNAPLFSIASSAMRQGQSIRMLGRDIAQSLTSVVENVSGKKATPVEDFLARLNNWTQKQARKTDSARQEKNLWDRYDSLVELSADCTDTKQLTDKIEVLFSPNSARVTLSTIHKAKGMEFESVFILDPDEIGGGFQEWERQQEENLRYVAITRAMNDLLYVSSELYTD